MKRAIQRYKEELTIHLLKALPLLHFLRGDCVPYQQLVVQPTKIKWGDPELQLATVQHLMYYKKGSALQYLHIHLGYIPSVVLPCRFMKEHYKELEELFHLDPLLVLAVAYLCPASDLANLCDNIEMPYAIAIVAMKLESIPHFSGSFAKVRHNILYKLNTAVMLSHTA